MCFSIVKQRRKLCGRRTIMKHHVLQFQHCHRLVSAASHCFVWEFQLVCLFGGCNESSRLSGWSSNILLSSHPMFDFVHPGHSNCTLFAHTSFYDSMRAWNFGMDLTYDISYWRRIVWCSPDFTSVHGFDSYPLSHSFLEHLWSFDHVFILAMDVVQITQIENLTHLWVSECIKRRTH